MNEIPNTIAYLECKATLHATFFQNEIINKFAATPTPVDAGIVHDILDEDILQLLNIAKVIKDCLVNSDGEQYSQIIQVYISRYDKYFLEINELFSNPQEKVYTEYKRQYRTDFTCLFETIRENLARGII